MKNDGGKGSAPRPIPNPEKFRDNWEQIFGKKKKEDVTLYESSDDDDVVDDTDVDAVDEMLKKSKNYICYQRYRLFFDKCYTSKRFNEYKY